MMKQLRVPLKGKAATAESLAASFNGTAYNVEYLDGYSVFISVTGGTAAGDFKLQGSNNAFVDNVGDTALFSPDNPLAVWDDIDSSSQTVAGAGTFSWNVTDVFYEAFRYVYTRTGGTGSASAYVLGKGQGGGC